jgi:transposase InsO family protein
LGLAAAALAGRLDSSTEDGATRDGDRLASQGLAPLLDLEVGPPAGPGPARDNRLWGTERIRGELLKLAIAVSNRSIRRYRWRGPKRERSQTWRAFLCNQIKGIWAADLFVVQTIGFRTLYVFFFISHERGELVQFNVTASPTAAWIWRQVIEATAWGSQLRHMIHDRDNVYGHDFATKLAGIGIADVRTPYRAPLANSVAERVVRTFRQQCLDHVIVLNGRHLFALLSEFVRSYNHDRPHRTLELVPPVPNRPMSGGAVVCRPILGGFHHIYSRAA